MKHLLTHSMTTCCLFGLLLLGDAEAVGGVACEDVLLLTAGTATYQVKSPEITASFTTHSVTKGNKIQMTSSATRGDPTLSTWECNSDGVILKTDAGDVMGLQNSFLPAATSLKPAYHWKSSSHIMIGKTGMIVNSVNTAIGKERVDTPAGRFVTWRIRIETQVVSDSGSRESLYGPSPKLTSQVWYAIGIGLVKSLDSEHGISYTLIKLEK
jgi:hypothetical protein